MAPDGTEWTVDPASGSITATGSIDSSSAAHYVSCPSWCVAVSAEGRVVVFDPGNPSGATAVGTLPSGVATGIACPSSTLCMVSQGSAGAASFNPNAGTFGAIASWADDGNVATSVACPTTDVCLVGDDAGRVLTGDPTQSAPTVAAVPGANSIAGVGCVSASTCVAVDRVGHAFTGLAIPIASAPPTISGTPTAGQTLTLAHGTWANVPTSYGEQWLACDATGNWCTPISGATDPTLPLTDALVGRTIRVRETGSNAVGAGVPSTSAPTTVVAAADEGGGGSNEGNTGGGGGGSGGRRGSGGSGGSRGGSAATATASIRRIKAFHHAVALTVRCAGPSSARCAVTLTLKRAGRTIGKRKITLTAPASHAYRIRLTKTGRALLAHHRRLKAPLVAVQTIAGSSKIVGRAQVTLHR